MRLDFLCLCSPEWLLMHTCVCIVHNAACATCAALHVGHAGRSTCAEFTMQPVGACRLESFLGPTEDSTVDVRQKKNAARRGKSAQAGMGNNQLI